MGGLTTGITEPVCPAALQSCGGSVAIALTICPSESM